MTKTFASWLKKHREILCALGINLLFLLICRCFSHMQFGTNDDRDISNLLANVYGGEDGYYIAFVNVFLCKALAALYKITNNAANWYVIISVGVSYFAGNSILYPDAPGKALSGWGCVDYNFCGSALRESLYCVSVYPERSVICCGGGSSAGRYAAGDIEKGQTVPWNWRVRAQVDGQHAALSVPILYIAVSCDVCGI